MAEKPELKEKQKADDQILAFNSSIATLERINEYIIHADLYLANDHIFGFKQNLYLLYIHSRGFLEKPELEKADRDWEKIKGFSIVVMDDEKVVFDDKLLVCMTDFYMWLLFKLHKHRVTMASKREGSYGTEKLMKKYGLVDYA